MEHTRFVGLDIHKERISIAVAESGRSGAVEYLGEISNDPVAIGKLCDRLGRPDKTLAFCYEAGPCGYGAHRQLTSLGHRCDVVAPSLIPTKPGDRVKTNRRDGQALAHAVSNKVEAAYRRGDLFLKRSLLMAEWARYCGTLPAAGATGQTVVPMRKTAP